MLEEYRKEINAIDKDLVRLYEKRLDLAAKIAREKARTNQPIYVPEREAQVYDRVAAEVENPNHQESVHDLYETILRLSRQYQEKVIKNEE